MTKRTLMSRAGMLVLVTLPWMHGWAAAPAESEQQLEKIQQEVQSRFPRIHIDHVAPAPWPGLYAVFTDEEIVYTNASADWILMGQLLDAHTQKNMTAAAWDEYKRIDYGVLPFDSAFTIVRGKGTRQLALFADPLCPFCRELETSLEGIDDLTVHLFLYPLESLHPGATTLARRIWCAPDRALAWRDWMLRQKETPAGECGDGPIPRLAALGRSLKIDSTPTLFLSDGRRISGTLPKEQLEHMLASPPPAAATGATDKP